MIILVPLALIWAGTHFFLDRGLRLGLEKAGTAANGARVELGGVSTRFWGLTLALSDLRVTDANNPLTNAVQIETLRFKLAPKPLFWKKCVVDSAQILGVRTGTPRSRSGALPGAPAGGAEKESPSAVAEAARNAGGFALGNIKDQYDPDKWVTLDSLASYKRIQEEKDRLAKAKDEWPDRWRALDSAALADRVRTYSDKVKNEKFSGVEGVKKAKDLLDEGKSLRADVEKFQNSLREARSAFDREAAAGKVALADIERLKKEDIDRRLALVRSGFSADGVTRALVGPVWMGKIQTALGWFHKIQKLRGAGDKKTKTANAPAPAPRGQDIAFPFHYRWPTFLLKTADVSGSTLHVADRDLARMETAEGIHYDGALKDVSSDPEGLGRPITLNLAGKSATQALQLDASLDLAPHPARGTAALAFNGLSLAGVALGNVGGPVTVDRGVGRLTARLKSAGENIDGTIDLDLSGLRLKIGESPDKDAVARALKNALAGVTHTRVTFEVSGTATQPRIKISSTLDKELNGILKNAAKGEMDALEGKLKSRVSGLVDGDRSQLAGLLDGRLKPIGEKLGGQEKSLDAIKDRLENSIRGAAGPGASPDLKNIKSLFKKRRP
ncbi:MAG: TIGR03545 family protein [Elusimicrobia bacterium]|nr:TIGR03545 family protein [Elusimicrobiota bacterium]